MEIAPRVEYICLENARRMLARAEVVETLINQLLCRAQGKGPSPLTQDQHPAISNN